jgi:hypothetical protein
MESKFQSLSGFATFGDVAAEDDAVLEYFLATNAVRSIEEGRAFLVLGRKGTGKTAIVRHFTEGKSANLSRQLNLRGYPWNIHSKRIDYGSSDIEAYVSSWRYLIAVELASLVLSQQDCDDSFYAKPLRTFLIDNYGGISPNISDIIRPKSLKLGKFSLSPSVMGNQLGGVEFDRTAKDDQFGMELAAVTKSIMSAVFDIASEAKLGPISLHFDELDQGLSKLDDSRKRMLIGLILAAREIRRDSSSHDLSINPVIYLRTDLWEELHFSDKNKISQTLTLHLGWKSESLLELVEARLRAKLSAAARWTDIATPDLIRGKQTKWNHILARTFLRPRDTIQFLNIILSECKKRNIEPANIINKDLVEAKDEYSTYLKAELDDEIRPHWPNWDEAMQACSAVGTITFDRSDFDREYSKKRTEDNPLNAEEALRQLYRFSVIGYEKRSGYGGSGWAFQYADPEAGWDNSSSRFKVHLGLKEYAKLKESRQQ